MPLDPLASYIYTQHETSRSHLSATKTYLCLDSSHTQNYFPNPDSQKFFFMKKKLYGSYFQKGKFFHFGKESIFSFWKNHPLSEDKQFKLLLCMSLVVGAMRNISLSDDKYIWKFFTEGFENLPSSFSFNSENLLSSSERCTWPQFFFPFGKMADKNDTALPHETDFDISKNRFC